jgi:hypothetical protein
MVGLCHNFKILSSKNRDLQKSPEIKINRLDLEVSDLEKKVSL